MSGYNLTNQINFIITFFFLKTNDTMYFLLNIRLLECVSVDWSGRRRLQREQRELKAPQERSDEEIEAVPAESVRLERKSTLFGF